MMPSNAIVIIADSHVSQAFPKEADDFFAMLERISALPYDVAFLGDVFELWVALDGYEGSLHKRFLDWCAAELPKRRLLLLEGNHEYFAATKRAAYFTQSVETELMLDGGVLLAHGDLINTRDRKYRFMRFLFKSWLAKAVLGLLASYLGPRLAERIRVGLKSSNLKHKRKLPHEELERYAQIWAGKGAKSLIVGHFHENWRHLSRSGVELNIVPEWRDDGQVALLDPASGKLECLPWRQLE